MECSINFCKQVAEISNEFEKNNSDLKRKYLLYNIMLYNNVVSMVDSYCGSFGTGYPFYALTKDLTGQLPVIDEQFRYNNELISHVDNSKHTIWSCFNCLSQNGSTMPDLKQICKPCPNMDDELKPRKLINRLSDVDMWMICKDNSTDSAKDNLIDLFQKHSIHTSDIDPIQTINDLLIIVEGIKNSIMPEKLLPFDTHIVEFSTLFSLIEQVPFVLRKAIEDGTIPYLPIHPLSYRKTWQYDDAAYNFIHDYLSSFTEFNFSEDLNQLLSETRSVIANNYSFEQLYYYLIATGPQSVKRRHKTKELKERFRERIDLWKEQ